MNLPGGMTVRYKCVGCGHKMDATEHARNLTTEKVDMGDGFEHTMTVILCDTCKPIFDRLSWARPQGADVLTVIEQVHKAHELNAQEAHDAQG